jgi:hypothetical protein
MFVIVVESEKWTMDLLVGVLVGALVGALDMIKNWLADWGYIRAHNVYSVSNNQIMKQKCTLLN